MHLAVVLVVIRDKTPYVRIDAVGVGHGAVVRVVLCTLAVVAVVEHRALEGGVGSVGDLAVRALACSDRTRGGAEGALAGV